MDLIASMLEQELQKTGSGVYATRLCPPMQRRFSRRDVTPLPAKLLFNADRALNRFWDYPRWIKRRADQFDVFHIVDHSYAQLIHHLPVDRTVVTCHDLDTFRAILAPEVERTSFAVRTMAKRTLSGFRKAARVICPTDATKKELDEHGLADSERVFVVHNGVHPSCSPAANAAADKIAYDLLGPIRPHDLLHVGTTVQRKRIDVLLEVAASIIECFPDARLIRVGGALTRDQAGHAKRLGISDRIMSLPYLARDVLASVYRRCALLLLPSEREGFGLPLTEAMACGTPAVISQLPALREVGGDAATYCRVGDLDSWISTVSTLLEERRTDASSWQHRRDRCIRQASQFTWAEYARSMTAIYSNIHDLQKSIA
jgi:glycosyltransferase involved in cell wall biosynthesis